MSINRDISIVYYGNQNVGVDCLQELIRYPQVSIKAVVALEKDPNESLEYRSVKDLAENVGLRTILCPSNINSESFVKTIKELDVDYGISVAWRKIFHKNLIDIHKRGIINFHGSYLPHYRGAVPTNWAIINGEKTTGVSVHFIDEGIDTGPIILQEKIGIKEDETAWQVRQRQDKLSVSLMRELAKLLLKNETLPTIEQDLRKGRTYGIRKPEDGLINFEKSAEEIYNFIRALARPYPGAFTFVQGKKMMIWEVEKAAEKDGPGVYFKCGDGNYLKIIDAEIV